jgi:hypothetical protein
MSLLRGSREASSTLCQEDEIPARAARLQWLYVNHLLRDPSAVRQ